MISELSPERGILTPDNDSWHNGSPRRNPAGRTFAFIIIIIRLKDMEVNVFLDDSIEVLVKLVHTKVVENVLYSVTP